MPVIHPDNGYDIAFYLRHALECECQGDPFEAERWRAISRMKSFAPRLDPDEPKWWEKKNKLTNQIWLT